MFPSLRILRQLLIGLLVVCVGKSQEARAQTKLSDEVRRDLQQNAQSVQPVLVEWRQERSSALPRDRLATEWKVSDQAMQPREWRLAAKSGKMYLFEQGPTDFTMKRDEAAKSKALTVGSATTKDGMVRVRLTSVTEIAFDLRDYQQILLTRVGPELPMLTITDLPTLVKQGPDDRLFIENYLKAAGYVLPNMPRTLGQPVGSLLLDLLDHGGTLLRVATESLSKTECTVVDVGLGQQTYTFYLDPAFRHAVRRQIERRSDKKVLMIDNQDFVNLQSPTVWLPKLCRLHIFVWTGEPKIDLDAAPLLETLTVTKLTRVVPDAQFVLNADKPGSTINDSRIAEAKEAADSYISYKVPGRPKDLDRAIDEGIARMRLRDHPEATHRYSPGLIAANLAGLVLFVSIVIFYRRKSKSGHSR
jgi:hypothetical protein